MIVCDFALTTAAFEAGIAIPEDLNNYDVTKFPYWHVLCNWQLGRPMPSVNSHFDNAKIIARVREDRINIITVGALEALGVV